jgi:uncharacterized membrane protein YdjX (TVP38/TMEM64 family)
MEEKGKINRRTAVRTLILTMLFVAMLVVLVSRDWDGTRDFILQSGWVGMVLSLVIYTALGASPIPSEPLTIFISTIYGPLLAMLIAGFGNLLAALLEYFIGEKIGDVATFMRHREKLPFGLGKFPVNSWVFLIAARILPGYGPKFVSVIAGLYRVPMWRYLWTSAVATFAGASMFAYGGFSLLQWIQQTFIK